VPNQNGRLPPPRPQDPLFLRGFYGVISFVFLRVIEDTCRMNTRHEHMTLRLTHFVQLRFVQLG
jgi:hypothetical protein